MKILFFISQGLSPIHAGKMSEVLYDLTKTGHDVHVVNCGNQLHNCFFNPTHNLVACAVCQSRVDRLLKQCKIPNENVSQLQLSTIGPKFEMPIFKSLNELMSYEYKGINLGRGVASSIISQKRIFSLNSKDHGSLIETELEKAILVHNFFDHELKENKPDKIYLFNGRFSECLPLLELAKKHKIPFAAIESGSIKTRYMIFENSLPHSITQWEIRAQEYWESLDKDVAAQISNQWYKDKRSGTQKNDVVDRCIAKFDIVSGKRLIDVLPVYTYLIISNILMVHYNLIK